MPGEGKKASEAQRERTLRWDGAATGKQVPMPKVAGEQTQLASAGRPCPWGWG